MKLILTSDTHYGTDGKSVHKHARFWKRIQKTIADEDVRALIWAGDLACNRQRQLQRSLQQARNHITIPILLVRGNHDWWDAPDKKDKEAGYRSFNTLSKLHKELFERYSVHHLEDGPKVIDDLIICGWDGWYGSTNPPTNDDKYMFLDHEGLLMHKFMANRAHKKFLEVLDVDVSKYRKSIAVTHHNPYTVGLAWAGMCANYKYFEEVTNKFDIFCCGHNHRYRNDTHDGCKVLNAGADYNRPKYILFDV